MGSSDIEAWEYSLMILKGLASASDRKATVEALLHQTNLWSVRKKALSGFSGGMRQRFGIAQALIRATRADNVLPVT
jgi:ABC-type multidrug transport system ATPase subunit